MTANASKFKWRFSMKLLSLPIALAIGFLSLTEPAMAYAPQIGNGIVGSIVATAILLAVVSYPLLTKRQK
jgi:hypothetical protein